MGKQATIVLLFVLLSVLSANTRAAAADQPGAAVPRLELLLEIDPARQWLTGRAAWTGLPALPERVLFLNGAFRIDSLTAAGQPVPFSFDSTGKPPRSAPKARPLIIDTPGDRLELAYSGAIRELVSGVNLISSELVELALYSGFYPSNVETIPLFEFRLELLVPAGMKVATNGRQVEEETLGERKRYLFESVAPSMDIALIASPALRVKTRRSGAGGIALYHRLEAEPLAERGAELLARALEEFQGRFGETAGEGRLSVVFSPRSGWGYSRLPMIIVSEQRAMKLLKESCGVELSLQGCVHELAHFWWLISDPTGADDWINEGLAEYSALSFMARESGENCLDSMLIGYLKDIRAAKTGHPVIGTPFDSPDRYVNWYEKTALLLYAIEVKYGRSAIDGFLQRLHSRFGGTRSAMKHDFFEAAEAGLGAEGKQLLESFLTAPGWTEDQLRLLAEMGGFADAL